MSVIVKNTVSLRQNYGTESRYMIRNNRSEVSSSQLSYTDATALRRSVRKLASYDYQNSNKDELGEKLKAFTDTYNYLKESGTKTGKSNAYVSSAIKKMDKLTEEYKSELDKYGITKNSQGYLSMSDSATSNINNKKFEKLFGKDSEFMQSISQFSKSVYKHIDLQL